MKSSSIQLALAAFGTVAIAGALGSGALDGPGSPFGSAEIESVLVVVVPDEDSARRVRGAIRPERVLWRGDPGLALVGTRVVASSLEGAGEVIEEAGWVERPIEIVHLEPRARTGGRSQGTPVDGERLARLRALVDKPTLTRAEQIFVLQAMNDGLEI